MEESAESLTKKIEQLTALVAGLVEKVGLTEADLEGYMRRRHVTPTGETGDAMRKAEAETAFCILKPRSSYE